MRYFIVKKIFIFFFVSLLSTPSFAMLLCGGEEGNSTAARKAQHTRIQPPSGAEILQSLESILPTHTLTASPVCTKYLWETTLTDQRNTWHITACLSLRDGPPQLPQNLITRGPDYKNIAVLSPLRTTLEVNFCSALSESDRATLFAQLIVPGKWFYDDDENVFKLERWDMTL